MTNETNFTHSWLTQEHRDKNRWTLKIDHNTTSEPVLLHASLLWDEPESTSKGLVYIIKVHGNPIAEIGSHDLIWNLGGHDTAITRRRLNRIFGEYGADIYRTGGGTYYRDPNSSSMLTTYVSLNLNKQYFLSYGTKSSEAVEELFPMAEQ